VARIFTDLRIVAGGPIKWQPPNQIGIALPGQETVSDVQHLERAIAVEAHKHDNRRKLNVPRTPERHLFVCIDFDNFPAWHAINEAEPPARTPALPDEITHVWAVAITREPDMYIVWRGSVTEHWSRAGMVSLTQDQIQSLKIRAS
jgi:hypothetical protein